MDYPTLPIGFQTGHPRQEGPGMTHVDGVTMCHRDPTNSNRPNSPGTPADPTPRKWVVVRPGLRSQELGVSESGQRPEWDAGDGRGEERRAREEERRCAKNTADARAAKMPSPVWPRFQRSRGSGTPR